MQLYVHVASLGGDANRSAGVDTTIGYIPNVLRHGDGRVNLQSTMGNAERKIYTQMWVGCGAPKIETRGGMRLHVSH